MQSSSSIKCPFLSCCKKHTKSKRKADSSVSEVNYILTKKKELLQLDSHTFMNNNAFASPFRTQTYQSNNNLTPINRVRTRQITQITRSTSVKKEIDKEGHQFFHEFKDKYGRLVPKPSHGTIRTKTYTQSSKIIREQFKKLYEKITDPTLMIRKVNLSACNLKPKEKSNVYEQVSLFENNENIKKEAKEDEQIKLAILKIKHKYGKNAILNVSLTNLKNKKSKK